MTNIKNRTQKYLLETALDLLNKGIYPTVQDVAKEAEISRATAYRYFPTQTSLIQAIVEICLQPILEWQPSEQLPLKRIHQLLDFAYPILEEHESAFRAALSISLQEWEANKRNEHLVRGHRRDILDNIAHPLKNRLSEQAYNKLLYAYSLIYGPEVFVVLKDIWNLELQEITHITKWIADAVTTYALKENTGSEEE
ncbi:TetR family transcriptional regulator [Cricetibacter osteomyelitidis]|uniref:TetR family transcriptional regulator n=1 Tax=Cricetibacter osteomyelitidis TaxID=1521931 RepID=A0A4R2SWB8_9PAST|nr:TetR/AcrR family transcriptional regulator [Cricetibacter osteomyelitidis]TCP88818.1 TetR family transcriptional regulator [Cricetibacter osteomyelitidis]